MFTSLIAFLIQLCAFLMEAAIFFLMIRIIVQFVPAKPLLFLDRIGDAGVEAVTNAIMARTGRWFKKPLTGGQEYALTLLVLLIGHWLLAVVMTLMSSKAISHS
jgi:hypothetical protein